MSAPRLETQAGKTQAVMWPWVESGEIVFVWVSLSRWSTAVRVCSFFNQMSSRMRFEIKRTRTRKDTRIKNAAIEDFLEDKHIKNKKKAACRQSLHIKMGTS